ncbi:unnamed protein product [Notodromas monacha]|uniref:Uncharacterized protein n=1 Tax=Notodromas monacha TaxID=399045 RepID=A0A7R9C2H8_9CRUS|nr:unnamed protein product [Notodromas monacha]CAG0925118.1 unnamed protein product [Notodromas monacha]
MTELYTAMRVYFAKLAEVFKCPVFALGASPPGKWEGGRTKFLRDRYGNPVFPLMEEDGSAVSMESRLEAANMCQRVLAKMLENDVGGVIGKHIRALDVAILFAVTITAGDPLKETLLCPGQGPMWKDDGTAVEGKPPNSNHRHFVCQSYRPCELLLDGGYDKTFATDSVVSITRQRGKDGQFVPGDVVIVKATGVEKVVADVHQKSYWVVGLGGRQLVLDNKVRDAKRVV